jgi:hypothetical protein
LLIINFIILAKTRRPVLVVGTHSDDPSCTKKVVTETLDKMHKKYKGKINNNNNNDDNNIIFNRKYSNLKFRIISQVGYSLLRGQLFESG